MRAWIVVATVVFVAGCTPDATDSTGDRSRSTVTVGGVASEAAPSSEVEAPDEFTLDHKWTKAGMTLSFDRLSIADVDQVCAQNAGGADAPRDLCDEIDGGEPTIVWLDMTVANDTGDTFAFGPDRGVIVIGSRRTEAEMFAGSTAPNDVDDGATIQGQFVWLLPMPLDQVLSAGQAQVTVMAPGEGKPAGVAGYSQTTITW